MKGERVGYYDALNICAALSVVFMHCNGIVHTYSNSIAWKQALFIEVICYWAVPVFFMLSGATLLEYKKKYSTKQYFQRRFSRTVIPYLIWSGINALIKGIDPWANGFRGFVGDILHASYEGVYWFFFPLFAVYMCIPIMAALIEKRDTLWYMLVMGFILNSLLPAIFKETAIAWNTNLSIPMMGGFLLYPLLGYLLATTDLEKRTRMVIYTLGILGAMIRYMGTYLLSTSDGVINKTFFDYNEYYSFFLAAAIFTFFKYSRIINVIVNNKYAKKMIICLSSLSFGVYLSHMIVYRALAKVISVNTWIWRLIIPFVIYGICILITCCIKKLPLVKIIVP